MKISLNWLKEFIEIKHTPDEVADTLTMGGLEVEAIETVEKIKGGLREFLVGEVKSVLAHPNADKLKLCQVALGVEQGIQQIVCGAANVAKGQKVAVALPGTTIYPIEAEPLTLKKAKIRGEESLGMLCAEDELGIGASHDGIIELPPDYTAGEPLSKYIDVGSDVVFDIGLTPNRTDAMSHYGVARDLAALTGTSYSIENKKGKKIGLHLGSEAFLQSLEVEDEVRCPRYTGLVIRGVKVTDSPQWLKDKLLAIDQRPINNIVDVTNYILHGLGQPLHAFDLDKITGSSLRIKTAEPGTAFTTLDEKTHTLTDQDLMICDAEKPLCIAGVMGGLNSGVSEATTNIFLESAYFLPATIRRTVKQHTIHTDTAYRFERGVDPEMVLPALHHAAVLIQELAGGEIYVEIDTNTNPYQRKKVLFSYSAANKLAGQAIPNKEINRILNALGIEISSTKDADTVMLSIPGYRTDVHRQQDVVEEILRVYGYGNIQPSTKINSEIQYYADHSYFHLQEKVSNHLSAIGLREIKTNSLLPERGKTDQSVGMLNPLSEDVSVLRESMLHNGMEVLAYNMNRQQPDLRFYEFGKTYKYINDKYIETNVLAIYITGQKYLSNWAVQDQPVDYYSLKSIVSHLAYWLGVATRGKTMSEDTELSYGEQLAVSKKTLGKLGMVKPEICSQYGIEQDVFFSQLNWDVLCDTQKTPVISYRNLPRFPFVKRDISMNVPVGVQFKKIKNIVQQCNPKLIKDVSIIDVYHPKGKDQVSYTISLELQDDTRTLVVEEVDKMMQKVHQKLTKELDVELRVE